MENLSKEQLLELVEAYEAIIIEVAADLHDGEKPEKIYYRMYKNMQSLLARYIGELM